MGPFSNVVVSWSDLTSLTHARNRQAQQSFQAALSKGITANNHGPQTQDSVQTDESRSVANSDIHVPRAGMPEDGGDPQGHDIDVLLVGRRLHADNENINEQKQVLSQDAVNDTPYVPGYTGVCEPDGTDGGDSGDGDQAPDQYQPRPGASNIGGQSQTSIQDKEAAATTRTRLIELAYHPVQNRYGTIADLADIRANTTAINVQEQELAETAILGDQIGLQTTDLGASNVSPQEIESVEALNTRAAVDIQAPVKDDLCIEAIGTGTFHGSAEDIHAEGVAASWQSSTGSQVAIDANISGGNGEAVNAMPQSQTNLQEQDTSSTVRFRPRAFINRDDSATAKSVSALSSSDNDQAQNGSQVAEVQGFGGAYNSGPAQQLNYQDSVTVTSFDVVF